MLKIRIALPEDAKQVAEIYRPFVQDSAVSFEKEPPSEEEIMRRIGKVMGKHMWLVCLDDDEVIGYSYATTHRDRHAYQWAVETSTYIREDRKGKGIGSALLQSLHAILKLQGYTTAYAILTKPNDSSHAFHSKNGYEKFAEYPNAGYKLGKWHDTEWLKLDLNEHSDTPPSPLPVNDLDLNKVVDILANGHAMLNS